jgi:Fic family protein
MELNLPVTRETFRRIASLDEFRGAWNAGLAVPSDRLERVRQAALGQSVGSSCRLCGIRVSDAEVAAVLADPSVVLRDKKEILGYAAALSWQPPEGERLLSSETLRRFHAVLMGASEADPAPSPWRREPSMREAFSPDGTAIGRVFQTLPPRLIEEKVEDLLTWLEFELLSGHHHPVLVIGTFALALLAASPFDKGNGRLGRALSVRLLCRAGYAHMPYASLERILEETRDASYDAYDRAESHIWAGKADLEPWLAYFVGTLEEHVRRVRAVLEVESRALRLSDLQRKILDTIRDHGSVDAALLLAATGASRNTLKDNMRRLVRMGLVDRTGERRGTRYLLSPGGALPGTQAPTAADGRPPRSLNH